jgi:hypothetical protein
VDGTLADKEREGHLPACNDAVAELSFPVRWTWDDSAIGLGAALAAGLPRAVFYNDHTFGNCFAGAALAAASFVPFRLDNLLALRSRQRAAFPIKGANG